MILIVYLFVSVAAVRQILHNYHCKMEAMSIVTPGTRVGEIAQHSAGDGVYIFGDFLYASVTGKKEVLASPDGGQLCVRIVRAGCESTTLVPATNDIVTCQVTKIYSRQVAVDIVCVGSVPLSEPFQGKIRCGVYGAV